MPTQVQIAELNLDVSAAALLSFIIVEHPALPGGILRYVTDPLEFVWEGNTYTPIGGVEIPLADDSESASRLRIIIPNIDKKVGQTLRRVATRIKVTQHLISTADFDLTANPRVEVGSAAPFYSMTNFEVLEADFDALSAQLSLILRDYSQAQYGLYAIQFLLPGINR